MSNNFSSARYSCWECQTALCRFVTSHFVEQIALRMRRSNSRGLESSRQRQPHLLQLAALGQTLVVENNYHEVRSAGFPAALPNTVFARTNPAPKSLEAKRYAPLDRRHSVPLLFLAGISRGREVVGHPD